MTDGVRLTRASSAGGCDDRGTREDARRGDVRPVRSGAGRRTERARGLCQTLNATREGDQNARRQILRELFGRGGDSVCMQPPFFCDYGINIEIAERVFFNFNCVVLDVHPVRIGSFTRFGPAMRV